MGFYRERGRGFVGGARSGPGHDFKGTHHLVGGMFEQMAVPDVSAGITLETDDDPSDGFGIGLHCVFPSALAGRGQGWRSAIVELAGQQVFIGIEALAVEDLEADQMEMDGMNVAGGVGEAPYLYRIELGALGDGLVPASGV